MSFNDWQADDPPSPNERTKLLTEHDRTRSLPVTGSPLSRTLARRGQSWLRWVVLLLISEAQFGNYYCYDIPAALVTQMKSDLNITDIQYNLIYSIYSLPNTVLPLFGGMLVDRIGMYTSMCIFASFTFIGQLVVSAGVMWNSYYCILIGRFLFGCGAESATVACSALMAIWFKNKEMGLSQGVVLSIGRIGSVINYQFSPYFASDAIQGGFWAGCFMQCLSFASVLAIFNIDRFWVKNKVKSGYKVESIKSEDDVDFSYMFEFHYIFWLLNGSCVLCYGCILPFMNIASDFFQIKWMVSQSLANDWISIPYTISAIGGPFLGMISDRAGLRQYLILVSSIGLTIAHLFLGLAPISFSPVYSLVIMGCSYAVYASAMWPSAALLVDDTTQLGTAYGVITTLQNIGLTLVPILVGFIKQYDGYFWVQIFFSAVGIIATIFGILILMQDRKTGRRLAAPTKQATLTNSAKFAAIRASRSSSPNRFRNSNSGSPMVITSNSPRRPVSRPHSPEIAASARHTSPNITVMTRSANDGPRNLAI